MPPVYEQERALHTYLLFHYGSREEILAGSSLESSGAVLPEAFFRFPAATVSDTFDLSGAPWERALDLGCAVGRSAFELSRHAEAVLGIDLSRSFIASAEALRAGRPVPFLRYAEAHLGERLLAAPPGRACPDRIRFETGDAMNLRADLGSFDLVHAANLLCRLADPARLLQRLPGLVKPGGQLVLATPATWMEDFTPVRRQPTGPTLDDLHRHLDEAFERRKTLELPFLIREHSRKFQISTSQTSLWIRRR